MHRKSYIARDNSQNKTADLITLPAFSWSPVIKILQQNMDDADLMTDSFYKSQHFTAAVRKIVS